MQIKQTILSSLYLVRQAIFAGLCLVIILAFYNQFSDHLIFNVIGLSSIASTIFLIFTAPHTLSGQNKSIIGGYAIAIVIGVSCHYLLHNPYIATKFSPHLQSYFLLFCGGLTVFLAILFMTLLKMPHPPAMGFALGLVIDSWEPHQALVLVFCIIVVLTVIKHLLHFKPLID
ncbi:MAG: HPP family protein [Gammaproteobacteria bacterium]|nr:HPP family protein [Gammaproteobacteria bacterium]